VLLPFCFGEHRRVRYRYMAFGRHIDFSTGAAGVITDARERCKRERRYQYQ
jgi:hypothetical protein